MTPERLDQIETILLRAALEEPVDSRQRHIKLGLELVEGVRRAKQISEGAREKAGTFMRWYQGAKALVAEAQTILKDNGEVMHGSSPWAVRARKFITKVQDNAG